MIVTDVYPGKDLGTLELTITVFWSCRVSRSVARRTNRYCWRKRDRGQTRVSAMAQESA